MQLEKQLSSLAILAATKAGKYIASHRPTEIESKLAGSSQASQIVTEIDRQSQKIILDILAPSIKKYDLGLLAEETNDDGSRLTKDYFWCIDPLDGTLPFVEDREGYAVAISLITKAGLPLIGVVYNPCTHKCYSAVKGQGAFVNRKPFKPNISDNNKFTIYHHRSLLKNSNYDSIIEKYKAEHQQSECDIVSHAGAVMNAIWNIENQPAIYIALPKEAQGGGSIWDYAATVCIYNELGYHATDYKGQPLMLNNPDTIFMNQCGIKFEV